VSESDQIEQSQMPSPVSSPETTSGHDAGDTSRPLKRRRRETSSFQDFDAIFGISEPTNNSAQQATQFVRHHSYAGLKASSINRYEHIQRPPSTSDLLESLQLHDLPDKIYREPYYSNSTDVPKKARTHAGLSYHLKCSGGVAHLEPWKSTSNREEIPLSLGADVYLDSATLGGWEYANCPPSVKQVKRWLQTRRKFSSASPRRLNSQVR